MHTNHFRTGLALILICLITQASYGQRHRKGQYSFSVLGGIMDRIPRGGPLKANQQGYLGRAEFVRYTEAEHYWKAAYQYDRKYYRPDGATLVSARHTVGVDFAPVSLHDYRRTFYLSPVIGLFTGLEIINQNQRDLAIGLIGAQSRFTFGANVGLEGEVFLTDRLSLIGGLTERWYAVTDLSRLHSQAQVGLRFTFY